MSNDRCWLNADAGFIVGIISELIIDVFLLRFSSTMHDIAVDITLHEIEIEFVYYYLLIFIWLQMLILIMCIWGYRKGISIFMLPWLFLRVLVIIVLLIYIFTFLIYRTSGYTVYMWITYCVLMVFFRGCGGRVYTRLNMIENADMKPIKIKVVKQASSLNLEKVNNDTIVIH